MIGEVKREAKEKMKGNIWKFWGVLIVTGLITSVIENLPALFGAELTEEKVIFDVTVKTTTGFGIVWNWVTLIISAVLSVILVHYVLTIVRGKTPSFGDSFKFGFNHILTIFLVSLLESIFVTLGCLLFIIPGIIVALGLSLNAPIIVENPELGVMDVLKKSWETMKGHKGEYFLLGLSFIGWILLCLFVIPIIWVVPYMTFAQVVYYTKVIK